MNISRTRFKHQIVAEFIGPNPKVRTKGIIILCMGMHVPKKDELLNFYSEKGYWVFFPRYRGSWESSGLFLRQSPHCDILDVLNELPRGFKDLYTGKMVTIAQPVLNKVYLVGTSFGGPAAILASRHRMVRKVILLCPITNWKQMGEKGKLDKKVAFTKEAFGRAYRFLKDDWRKLEGGKFYNPASVTRTIDGSKLLIIHAEDDRVVPITSSRDFAKRTGALLVPLKKGGHIGSLILTRPKTHSAISRFFNQ